MKIFTIKKQGSTKEEEFAANTPEEVHSIHNELGIPVQIISEKEDPTVPSSAMEPTRGPIRPPRPPGSPPANVQNDVMSAFTGGKPLPPAPQLTQLQYVPENMQNDNPVFFEIDGKQCKTINGKVYTKDWQDVDMGEYRIVRNPESKSRKIENHKVQKLEWIEVSNEKKTKAKAKNKPKKEKVS